MFQKLLLKEILKKRCVPEDFLSSISKNARAWDMRQACKSNGHFLKINFEEEKICKKRI